MHLLLVLPGLPWVHVQSSTVEGDGGLEVPGVGKAAGFAFDRHDFAVEPLGHAPSPSESVMFHHAYKRLETLGLVERANLYGYGERTSHLRLTNAGERIARQLVEMEATR